ncbi:hypothetical protein LWI29_021733 [Acer saccharum]|uniref:Uncharacterized protein n=1 Tax=Acer saccharum TaxID=4024 RepID=A0AA39VBH1_ACESA|nr:hypothetical protein LWI29_021733 [Acer saccharum]
MEQFRERKLSGDCRLGCLSRVSPTQRTVTSALPIYEQELSGYLVWLLKHTSNAYPLLVRQLRNSEPQLKEFSPTGNSLQHPRWEQDLHGHSGTQRQGGVQGVVHLTIQEGNEDGS